MIATMINSLQRTNSTIDKQNILKDYAGLIGIQEILKYTYNPFFNYGISKKHLELYGIPPVENRTLIESERQVLIDLLFNGLSGALAVQRVINCMVTYGGLVGHIVSKDLRCGVSATTINKVCPKLIPTFEVQLAKEVPKEKWKFPAHMQVKYDGVRLVTHKSSEEVKFYTRNGKQVNLPLIAKQFSDSNLPLGYYDGEIVLDNGRSVNRTSVSGMINSAMHGGRINERALSYYLFDYLTTEEFSNRKSNRTEQQRYAALYSFLYKSDFDKPNGLPSVLPADTQQVNSAMEVDKYYADLVSRGFEGVILKPLLGLYTFKRNPNWIKLKETKSADLHCLGAKEGTGKYADMIGALDFRGIVEGKEVLVSVGTGLSDADRARSFDYYDGKCFEVLYNCVIPSKDGGKVYTLFLPRLHVERFDKEADTHATANEI